MLMLTAMLVLGSCELIDRQSGSCYSGSIGDGGAVIDGSATDPGDDGTIVVEGGDAADPDPVCARRVRDLCLESPATPADPATPTVTVSDVARFAPAIPALGSQPGGWAVQDLPANLLSPVTTQVVEGTVWATTFLVAESCRENPLARGC